MSIQKRLYGVLSLLDIKIVHEAAYHPRAGHPWFSQVEIGTK